MFSSVLFVELRRVSANVSKDMEKWEGEDNVCVCVSVFDFPQLSKSDFQVVYK